MISDWSFIIQMKNFPSQGKFETVIVSETVIAILINNIYTSTTVLITDFDIFEG